MSKQVAEEFLDEICKVDIRVRVAMRDIKIKEHVITVLKEGFDGIILVHPELVDDVQVRTVRYQKLNEPEVGVADFMHIIQWYKMYLSDEKYAEDYWDPKGKYYGIRMSEVINLYLISKNI